MKFLDGFWLLKDGVKPFSALQVTSTVEKDQGYDLQVSTRPIRHRGDTLGGPVLQIGIHSPTKNVVAVKLQHFVHNNPNPEIPLFPDAAPVVDVSLQTAPSGHRQIITGGLTAEITENPYTVTFKAKSRILTTSGRKYQSVIDVPYRWVQNSASNSSCLATDIGSNPLPDNPPKTVRYLHSELDLTPGTLVYGLGEQFGHFVKNGQSIAIWNQDGGTSSDQAYKCVPFYITNQNYGVFIRHFGEIDVEVGSEKVSRVGMSVADQCLEYYVIYGETPLEILETYTLLTGRPPLLPAWSFGLWLSTSFLTDYSSKTVSTFLEGMRERKCPVRVFHLDCFWMKGYQWCDFTFDPEKFPDPKAYLSEIKEKYNVQICVWINPYISQLSPIFKEGVEGGYFIKRKDSTVWQWDLWQPGLAVVDVTNPEARKWYCDKLEHLIDLGVTCFKTDFGERIPTANVQFHDGSDPYKAHNAYAVLYNGMVFKLLERRLGKGEAIVFARTSAAGGQRFPVHWGGDCESTFIAMAQALRGALSLTSSGFAFASHDIGGFEDTPTPEVYARWVAFGIFSSHSRLHGSDSYRVPWVYGEDQASYMARYLDTKHRLMPVSATKTGRPVQRAMFLEFPGDRSAQPLDLQYMLGPSLLVAPVFVTEGEESNYYIPEGTWTSFFHSERTVEGPRWVSEVVPLSEIPVFVRPNSILVLGPPGIGKPDYDFTSSLELRLYELAEGKLSIDIPGTQNGETAGSIEVNRTGNSVEVHVKDNVSLDSVAVFVKGRTIGNVQGGQVEAGLVKVANDAKQITFDLS
ncbi:alpha-glucosidase [Flagelloscypha sp. PMI_526]|nr:alpha-glucosidase [Flagelloscypha sp. PMI_526]